MEDPIQKFEAEALAMLNRALKSLEYTLVDKLEAAPPGKGDFAFPCFRSASEHKRKPNELAKQLEYVMEDNPLIERVVAMGPYLNFFIAPLPMAEEVLRSILDSKEAFGASPPLGKKVIIEHTSANPTGPFHVGRARNPIIGDSLTRVMRKAGYDVETQYWVNDMGKQAVIMAYGLEHCPGGEAERTKDDHVATVFYRQANERMEKEEKVAAEIEEWIRRVERGDLEIVDKVKAASKKVLAGMRLSLDRLNVKIDNFVWESMSVEDGSAAKVVEQLKGSELAREEDGAYYLDLEGLVHGRTQKFFFTRKDGTTLYATRDVAFHLWKLARCDMAINILGEDHKLEAKQLEAALKAVGSNKVPEVVFYAFVSLPSTCPACGQPIGNKDEKCPKCGVDVGEAAKKKTKMSTRKGRAVYIDDLIDEAVDRALEVVKEKRPDLSDEEKTRISELVGIGALRYNIIRIQAEKSIVFKWEDALNFEGKSAPFIQYSHARACSILREAGSYDGWKASDLKDEGEFALLKTLARLPGLVRRCADQRLAYSIAEYAHEVAIGFNRFYRDFRVLGSESQATRLAVVDATRWVLRNSLELLGIKAPESM
jgi:arginyl-tRNA synthetase